MSNEGAFRILSSGRKLETGLSSSVNRVLKSGRFLTNQGPVIKRQRRSDSSSDRSTSDNDMEQQDTKTISSIIQVSERKPRENEATNKLLLQAVTDANKSVLLKTNKTNGIVKVMKNDGTIECLTTRTLAKRLKTKEQTPSNFINKNEQKSGKLKIRIRNEYCSTNDEHQSNEQNTERTNSQHNEIDKNHDVDDDDDDDELVVVVNSDYETNDDINNIWMGNDHSYGDHGNTVNLSEYDSGKGNGTLKRKLSDDVTPNENDEEQYSPKNNSLTTLNKKTKRCRFWPDCNNGEQCEFLHPTQRCTHFPNCAYGNECLYIHPSCRFASACTRPNCPYLHSSSTTALPSTTANRVDSTTICKYGLQCMRPNCIYSHPRMPFNSSRNYKWVNSKWRASDDMPILPPTKGNTDYENSFVGNDATTIIKNSIEDEIEK